MVRSLVIVVLLTACAERPVSHYNGRYTGTLEVSCYQPSYIQADVLDGHFDLWLSMAYQHIHGLVTQDGELYGTGAWDDERGPVEVRFEGSISGPFFGHMFSGRVHDGRCNPYVELVPPQTK